MTKSAAAQGRGTSLPGVSVSDGGVAQEAEVTNVGAREGWQRRTQTPLAVLAVTFFVAYAVPILWPNSPRTLVVVCHTAQALTYLAFVGDYLARMFLSHDRKGYLRHSGLDIVVLALPALQPLRAMQLLTILRVVDKRIGGTLRGRIIAYLSFATVTVSLVGSLAVLNAERNAPGSNIRTFGDALWWATTTITTVGYGEHHPVTTEGRVVAACLMFSGIALLSVVTGAVASWILERMREEDGESAADDRMRAEVDALTQEIRALRADMATLVRSTGRTGEGTRWTTRETQEPPDSQGSRGATSDESAGPTGPWPTNEAD